MVEVVRGLGLVEGLGWEVQELGYHHERAKFSINKWCPTSFVQTTDMYAKWLD